VAMDLGAPGNLSEIVGVPVDVSRRLKRGWRLERKGGTPRLVVPEQLESAPHEVLEQLGLWVAAVLRPSPGSRLRKAQAARKVFEWMGETETKAPRESSQGQFFDLRPLFDQLNGELFEGRLSATLRWTPRFGTTSTHRKLGGADVLTISRRFDGEKVPLDAVKGVLAHEMLHIAHPPKGNGTRRHVHHQEFRRAERALPFYAAWQVWEKEQAHRPWWKRILGRKR